MMKRYEGTDDVTRAKNNVLSSMHGCGDTQCSACDRNRNAIDDLEEAVRTATLMATLTEALKNVGNDLE